MREWEWLPDAEVPARPMDLDGVGVDTPAWYADAACQGTDTEAFFPSGRGDAAAAAVAVCLRCPVRLDCLHHALQFSPSEDYGVWGGATEEERRKMRKAAKKPDPVSRLVHQTVVEGL